MKNLKLKIYSAFVAGLLVVFLSPLVFAVEIAQDYGDGVMRYPCICKSEKCVGCVLTSKGIRNKSKKGELITKWNDYSPGSAIVMAQCGGGMFTKVGAQVVYKSTGMSGITCGKGQNILVQVFHPKDMGFEFVGDISEINHKKKDADRKKVKKMSRKELEYLKKIYGKKADKGKKKKGGKKSGFLGLGKFFSLPLLGDKDLLGKDPFASSVPFIPKSNALEDMERQVEEYLANSVHIR